MHATAELPVPPSETVYLNEHGVLVTSTRVVSGGQMYPVAAIAAVSIARWRARHAWPIFCLLTGAALGLLGLGGAMRPSRFGLYVSLQEWPVYSMLAGIGVVIIAITVIRSRKATFHFLVQNSARMTKVVSSTDRAFVERISAAVSRAIIDRG